MARRKTHEEFVKEIQDKYNKEYSVIEEYKGAHVKILIKHNSDKCNNYEWKITPSSLLRGHGCPACGKLSNIKSKKKTHKKFIQEVQDKFNGEYVVLGKYEKNSIKILVRHNCKKCNYHEWKITPGNLFQGKGCPICRKYKSIKKNTKTKEQFIREIERKYNGEYTILGKYINTNSKILVRHNCEKCDNHEYEVRPADILRGKGCPVCKGGIRKTHEEFLKQINEKYHGEYSILEKYINDRTKLLVRHNSEKCNNYEWYITPNSILRGNGCPKCAGNIQKTTEQFKADLNKQYGNEYTVLGEYKNSHTKILVRHNCEKCNYHEWKVTPHSILSGRSCPVCSGREIKLGINTIYDTDPWMIDLGVSEEDAKKYSRGSKEKISLVCPDCGKEKKIRISSIYNYKSISCSCGDGKSYPEKFMMNVLDQLELNYEIEKEFEWSDKKRYDFYIPSLNMIIETHGEQHYDGRFKSIGGRTLEEEQKNDNYKKELALKNSIEYYIAIDCRESEINYTKSSILNSELTQLFNLNNINWLKCAEFANKNIVKEVCDYWNNKKEHEGMLDLSKIFKIGRSTIINYLKKGAKLGWCKYDPKIEMRKSGLKSGKSKGRKVEIFKNNKSLGIFNSCNELERKSKELFQVKLLNQAICDVCNGKIKHYKGYTFKYIK